MKTPWIEDARTGMIVRIKFDARGFVKTPQKLAPLGATGRRSVFSLKTIFLPLKRAGFHPNVITLFAFCRWSENVLSAPSVRYSPTSHTPFVR
jgi:hypothetical protein